MAKSTYVVLPQRSDGSSYVECPINRATSWAVFRQYTYKRKLYRVLVSRHGTKGQAQGEADSQNLGAMGPIRRYALGKRMSRN